MAEYSEVIKQFKRMCKSISAVKCTRGECPMGREFGCENIGQCRKIAFERYAEFEKLVMAWAKEHTEPKPITWADWLTEMGVIHNVNFSIWGNEFDGEARVSPKMFMPIPDDIVQKLDIKPEE